jgi:hypothetical protein
MPIHDWTRVDAGAFHSHHLGWMSSLRSTLNRGGLRPGFYAMAGHTTADGEPPTSVDLDAIDDLEFYAARRRRVTVFGEPDDRLVARIEMVTPGDRRSPAAVDWFVSDLLDSAARGLAVLVIDPFPTVLGTTGLADWLGEAGPFGRRRSPGRHVTFAIRAAGERSTWSISTAPLGGRWPDVVLPLESGDSASVPLEPSYVWSFEGTPRHLVARLRPWA